MIGIVCPSQFDTVFAQIKALAAPEQVERIPIDRFWVRSKFAVRIYEEIPRVSYNRAPECPVEWGVYFLAKGLTMLADLRESTPATGVVTE